MKKHSLLILLLLFLFTTNAFALDYATSTIKDVGFTSKFEYAIDIYVSSTFAFEVGASQLTVGFNAGVLSSPTLSHTTAFDSLYNLQLDNATAGQTRLQITPRGASGIVLSDSEIRVGRITFTIAQSDYRSLTGGIAWNVSPIVTFLSDITNTDQTLLREIEEISGNTSLVCLPTIGGTPSNPALVGHLYSFTPTVEDICGTGSLSYAISGKPDWADFSPANGELSGTPAFDDVSTFPDVEITVTDAFGDATTLTTFDLDVDCPPGPTFSAAVAPTTSIASGNAYSFTPVVIDGCGTLIFEIENQPDWAAFDDTTGALTSIAGRPDLGDVGTSSGIIIRVIDENGLADEIVDFDIEVTPDCVAPIISGTPLDNIASGGTYSFSPTVSNGCGAKSFSITNRPAWTTFDPATGALTGGPTDSDVGMYSSIAITVTDAFGGSDSLPFDIEVTTAVGSGDGGGGGGGCFISTLGSLKF